ncbi:MAG: hypothetical protein KAW40_02565 [Candidatus Aenigmarchaeota archaeon]|nr:hypothetical protein [Candidatus Aenigmarchaeota archaeon]
MIEFLLTLLSESPLLFVVLLVNLLILAYIIFRISLYIIHKKKPGQKFSSFIWKIKAKKDKEDIKTIEDVYAFIMEGIRKEGLLEKDEKIGFRSRKKILQKIPKGKKKKIIESLFELYEAKVYSNRRIKDEKDIVADILNSYSKF